MTTLTQKNIRLFLLIAFGIAWPLFALPLAFGSLADTSRQAATLIAWSAAMWAPGLAAIIVTRVVDREPLSMLRLAYLGERRAYLWAWLLPAALTVASGGFTMLLGAGRPDWQLTAVREALAQAGSPISPAMVLLIQVIAGLTIGPLINTLMALGEELGWRAYLLPKLLPLGQWRAIAVSGAIWGIWHGPAILQGHNYPDHPVLGVFLMVGFTVLFGTILSWLYLRTRSPWAPALGHASLNAVAGFPLLFIPKVDMAVGGALTSLIGWIPMLLFVGWLAWTKRLPVPEPPTVAAPE
jgi:membrane protease YdiL (CAAX protease family)